MDAARLPRSAFTWRGRDLCQGNRKILTLVPDEAFPHMFRIRYPNGWTSTLANLARCKDAGYAHARLLLAESAAEAPYRGERTNT